MKTLVMINSHFIRGIHPELAFTDMAQYAAGALMTQELAASYQHRQRARKLHEDADVVHGETGDRSGCSPLTSYFLS